MKSSFSPKQKKHKADFLLPPTPGYAFPLLMRWMQENEIEPKYWLRYGSTALLSAFGMPFRWLERQQFDPVIADFEIRESPVFILGHWRSGTTYLHNLLCQDVQMGCTTTFQSAFPENLLAQPGRALYYQAARFFMPKFRKGDNVRMHPEYPQEEELALGSRFPFSFYYFLFFPRRAREFYDRFVRFHNVSEAEKSRWQQEYIRLIKKSLINTGRPRYLSKNPANTARIRQLLELFPDARFIHIYRNPFVVFNSTCKFFRETLPPLQFQQIGDRELEENILYLYGRMMQHYRQDRGLIPEGNLVEVRFEELETDPIGQLLKVYETLDLPGFGAALPHFRRYVESRKGYEKNQYRFPQEEIARVAARWQFALEEWDYDAPLRQSP